MAASSWHEAQTRAARASAPAQHQPPQDVTEPNDVPPSALVERAQLEPRSPSSTRITVAVTVSVAMTASLLAGAVYFVISTDEPLSAAESRPVGSPPATDTTSDKPADEQRDEPQAPPNSPPRLETVADVRAHFSGSRRHSMTSYLYQVSSDRSFAEAVGHHDTLRRGLSVSAWSDNTEAALIIHKNGKYFCNVVLWTPPTRPPERVLDSMKTLLGEGAMLRTTATYCVCPQAAKIDRPDQEGRIEVVWCHDTEYGACPLSAPD
jgi:hypothetical protein